MHHDHQPAVLNDLLQGKIEHQSLDPQIGINCKCSHRHKNDGGQHHIRQTVPIVQIRNDVHSHRGNQSDHHSGNKTSLPFPFEDQLVSLPPSSGITPIGHQGGIVHRDIGRRRKRSAKNSGEKEKLRPVPEGAEHKARQRRNQKQNTDQVRNKQTGEIVHNLMPGVSFRGAVSLLCIQSASEVVIIQSSEK